MRNPTKPKTQILLAGVTLLVSFVALNVRADYSNTVASFNPLAYWRLNETASSPALNSIVNSGSLGTAANGQLIAVGPDGGGGFVDFSGKGQPGVVGTSLQLTNGNVNWVFSRVDVPYSAGLNPTAPFSVEFWCKPNSVFPDTTGACLLTSLNGNGFSGGSRRGWVIYVSQTGLLRFWLGKTAGYAGQLSATTGNLPLGSWTHVVATYDGATARLYTNGTPIGSLAVDITATAWVPNEMSVLRMGGTMLTGNGNYPTVRPAIASTGNTGNRPFDGWLDEVAIYASVLSPSDIAAHAAAATTNNGGYATQILAANPRAYWRMEDSPLTPPVLSSLPWVTNSGSAGVDANGQTMWGTLANQDGVPGTGMGVNNRSVYLDGASGSIDIPTNAALSFAANPQITMMAWIKPESRDYFRNILAHGLSDDRGETFMRISRSDDGGGGGTTVNYYEVGVCNAQPPPATFANYMSIPGNANNYYHAALYPIPAGDFSNWVFLAGTYDGANWNLYRNGVKVATYASANGALERTNSWSIGSRDPKDGPTGAGANRVGYNAWHGLRFGGHIDEPAIFGTALSDADILSIYNSTESGPTLTRAVTAAAIIFKGSTVNLNVWAEGPGTLSYQWYKDGVAQGVTATNLTINNIPVGTPTYSVVVTNLYGAVTSSVALNVIAAPPSFPTQPASISRYTGHPFSFSVVVAGSTPLSLQWRRNGIDILGQTGTSYSGTVNGSTAGSYTCIASNETSIVVTSSVATLTEISIPTGYGGTVYGDAPIAYWRLGESSGTTANDYYGGYNGSYFNSALNQPGYSALDADTAVTFSGVNSYAGSINGDPATGGINFQGHVNFTLEAWVNGPAGMAGESTIIAKGAGASGTTATEQFALDIATSPDGEVVYRFFTRGGGDSLYQALADVGPNGSWDHVVGVYDDLNVLGLGTNLHIFVNGELRGSAATRPAGLRASSVPVSIGSKRLGNNPNYDGTFNGSVDEVAVYNYALTPVQVSNHYAVAYGVATPPTITKQPASLTAYESSPVPVKFEVAAYGSQPLTYQWKQGSGNLVDGGNILGANTRVLTIDPVGPADATNYSVTINNSVGPATNSAVAILTVIPAPITNVNVPGLVLHLPFNGSLNDASGRGNHGTGMRTTYTSTNAAAPNGGNPDFNYVSDGALGQALHYRTATTNGGNGTVTNAFYVTLGDKPDLRFGTSVSFSVSYWARYPDVISVPELGDLPFICSAINSYGNQGYTFAPSYNLGSWSYSLDGTVQLYGQDHLLSDGLWHHTVHTFDRTGVGITYIDGRKVDTRSVSAVGNLDTGNPVNIGQDPTGIYPEEGAYDIDDIGIWRRALTSTEVVGIYLAATLANSTFVDISPSITPGPGANQVTITWQAGILQAAGTVNGTYTNVVSATSPYTVTPSGAAFYRTSY